MKFVWFSACKYLLTEEVFCHLLAGRLETPQWGGGGNFAFQGFFLVSDFLFWVFGGRKIWLDLRRDFWGIQNHLKIRGSALVS